MVSALVMISAFRTFNEVVPKYLRKVIFGSEVFPIKQYHIWRKALPDAEFFNLYGPTEATGMSCFYKCCKDVPEKEVIPIGVPFDNTEVLLLNESGNRVSDAEVGEIYLRGTCVALGYYRNEEATQEAFVQNPLNTAYPELVYKTGDLAHYDNDGNLVYVSRKDNQVKHMGHRIELGEIEAAALKNDVVVMAGCIWNDKHQYIVLYYTGNIKEEELLADIKNRIPSYMVPTRFKRLEVMPLTPNGKIDRKRLKEM